jgi:hypothetical protein
MKNITKWQHAGVALAALVASIGFSPTAKAQLNFVYEAGSNPALVGQSYTGGAITIKYSNFDMGTVYNVSAGTTAGTSTQGTSAGGIATLDGLAQTAATGSFGGEDSWGIAVVASIEDGLGNTIWSPAGKGQQLTVMFYGAKDFNLVQNGLSQEISSVGLHIDLYVQNFSDPGFTAYDGTLGSGGRLPGPNSYSNVTDGTLVLALESTAGFLFADGDHGGYDTEFFTRFQPGVGGLGSSYLDVVGGSMATNFDTNSVTSLFNSNTTDFFAEFTTATQNVPSDWLVRSHDPVSGAFIAVPEPSTYGLMAAGALIGIVALRRRFQKKA